MRHVAAGLAFAALLLAGCENAEHPTAGSEDAGIRFSSVPEEADLEARINGRINDLFPQPQKAEAHRIFDRIKDAIEAGEVEEASEHMRDFLVLADQTDLKNPDGETTEEVRDDLVNLMFEFVGLEPPIDDDDGTVQVAFGDTDNFITTEEEFAGTFIPDEALPDEEDVVIVIERLTEEEQANLPGGECLPTGLEQEEGCYQFDRIPEGDFESIVEVGVCARSGIAEEFQLHRFESVADGGSGVVEALPNIELTITLQCDPFTASTESPLPWRLAEAAWRSTGGRLVDWLGPQRLEAVNVGFGGSTTNFSRIGWARALDLGIFSGDQQTGDAGQPLPVDPTVELRAAHFDGSTAPVVSGTEVTFEVVSGGGTISVDQRSGAALTEPTDSDGLASVSWYLGSDGSNVLRASVPDDTVLFTAATGAVPTLGWGMATIDGSRGTDEWTDALALDVFAGDATLDGSELLVMNDGTNLYLALAVPDPLTADDAWELRFDNTNDGSQTAGDDELRFSTGSGFGDLHFDGNLWGSSDASAEGEGAAGSPTSGTAFFEISHPLSSGNPNDLDLSAGDVFGLCIRFFDDGGPATSDTDVYPPDCVLVANQQGLYEDLEVATPPLQ